MLKTLSVFGVSLLWLGALLAWNSFPDPDAFYHAKLSLLLWQHGPIMAFPWLDLTTLGTSFADHHFLFHVIEAPFVALFGLLTGARLTALFLAALFLAVTFACLRWLKIQSAWFWIVITACTQPLLVRLLLAKATPLALTLFVLGLAAAWKRKPILVLLIAGVFALSHGGWIFLVGSIALLALGEMLYRWIVESEPLSKAISSSGWREVVAAGLGALIGTTLHPNFPTNLSFLWIQVVKIGLGTPYAHVILGNEWLPTSASALLAVFAPWWILLLLGLVGVALAARKPLDQTRARAVIAFALPVAACVALTLKSRRNAEYLAPALILWTSSLWMLVDAKRLREAFNEAFSPLLRRVVMGVLVIAMVSLIGKGVLNARQALHRKLYPDHIYRDAMRPIAERAEPGDRVFHSDWDEFPVLFSIDDRLRYIAGLDPTFLYEASSTASDVYRDLTWGKTTTTQVQAWDVIHDRFGSRFIFIDKRDHAALAALIKTDTRYTLLAETPEAISFEVITP